MTYRGCPRASRHMARQSATSPDRASGTRSTAPHIEPADMDEKKIETLSLF
jgi:hypothetical protein